jgi:HTH-type transcriptional regulator/antitoxin HipB
MIKNQKQVAITKSKLEELKVSLSEFESQRDKINPIKYKMGLSAFSGLIKDLENQLDEYERLTTQNVNEFCGLQFPDASKFLIAARLAKRMSQKDLADKIGIQEQQIQRYELDDYSKASWSRLMEIYRALDLTINLDKITIIKQKEAKILTLPRNMARETVVVAIQATKRSNSLMFQNA